VTELVSPVPPAPYPTPYAYDLAVAELASVVEALWPYRDAGMVDIQTVLRVQEDADVALRIWGSQNGLKVDTKEDLVEVLRRLREQIAERFLKEVNG
jgi:hypothetical protein